MKTLVVVVAALSSSIGCLELPDESLATNEQEVVLHPGRCPDPSDCTVSNGGGVYTDEGGDAGFGPMDAMIERFDNVADLGAPYVSWTGRHQVSPDHWVAVSGRIIHAFYGGHQYQVTHVSESYTVPTFKLTDATYLNPIFVTGDQLLGLRLLIVSYYTPEGYFSLRFSGAVQHAAVTGDTMNKVNSYPLQWNAGYDNYTASTFKPYCSHAPDGLGVRQPDTAVFQQGIQVDPLTAVTVFDTTADQSVTLSCSGGAIATARTWGYAYRGDAAASTTFEAAMHMKRASYCGDVSYFTTSGTQIEIRDHNLHPNDAITDDTVEARWGKVGNTIRAVCVNLDRVRHHDVRYPSMETEERYEFNGDCKDENENVIFSIGTCHGKTFSNVSLSDAFGL